MVGNADVAIDEATARHGQVVAAVGVEGLAVGLCCRRWSRSGLVPGATRKYWRGSRELGGDLGAGLGRRR
ncbi:MAG TPA: hypothetical protein VGT01_02725 [Candidatus Dormibacteraeota bacterium]|nr:hypothetical protein [Candidatus Dormibacteraeota bacterium]